MPVADDMARHADRVSAEIHGLLHGIGERTQGAVLAELVAMWVAGHFEHSELAAFPIGGERPLTAALRRETLEEFVTLVLKLVPVMERKIMLNVQPEGRA